jgi:hypothetical protein
VSIGLVAQRRLQRWLLATVRRSRFFPRTIVNRQGDDDHLAGQSLDESVMIYFPGALDTLYQILPWLEPFEELHKVHPVVIVCQDSRVADRVRARTAMRVLTIARYGRLDDLLGRSDVKLALYVSHTPRNFECLRFASLIHVYLGHGDSDKGVSASNQLKAYDYAMVPGSAAVDRIAVRLINYDVRERCLVIGQPQHTWTDGPSRDHTGRCTVLYAPTWEGAQPSVEYSSLASHGPVLVSSLLADPRFTVIFRPHPLSGVTSPVYSRAEREITAMINAATRAHPDATHRIVRADAEPLEDTFVVADLLLCDISAVATAWLPTGRPLVLTVPASDQAAPADSGLVAAVPRLAVDEAADAAGLLWREYTTDSARDARQELARYYFDSVGADKPTERFIASCSLLIARRDEARRQLIELGGGAI